MESPVLRSIKFPCDCISSTPACEEPWARVAKEGMFKDGTKEEIINRLHREPQTVAQLAKGTGLSQPTILRHVTELAEKGLLQEFDPDEKDYIVERYYKPSFPVVTKNDQELYNAEITALAGAIAGVIAQVSPELTKRYAGSHAESEGTPFAEFAHFIVHRAQREARMLLEERGILASRPSRPAPGFIFWGAE